MFRFKVSWGKLYASAEGEEFYYVNLFFLKAQYITLFGIAQLVANVWWVLMDGGWQFNLNILFLLLRTCFLWPLWTASGNGVVWGQERCNFPLLNYCMLKGNCLFVAVIKVGLWNSFRVSYLFANSPCSPVKQRKTVFQSFR